MFCSWPSNPGFELVNDCLRRAILVSFNLLSTFLEITFVPTQDLVDDPGLPVSRMLETKLQVSSTHCCIKFMPSSAPALNPIQFVTLATLTLASITLIMALSMLATLPIFKV